MDNKNKILLTLFIALIFVGTYFIFNSNKADKSHEEKKDKSFSLKNNIISGQKVKKAKKISKSSKSSTSRSIATIDSDRSNKYRGHNPSMNRMLKSLKQFTNKKPQNWSKFQAELSNQFKSATEDDKITFNDYQYAQIKGYYASIFELKKDKNQYMGQSGRFHIYKDDPNNPATSFVAQPIFVNPKGLIGVFRGFVSVKLSDFSSRDDLSKYDVEVYREMEDISTVYLKTKLYNSKEIESLIKSLKSERFVEDARVMLENSQIVSK